MKKLFLFFFLINLFACTGKQISTINEECQSDSLTTNKLVSLSEPLILSGKLDSGYQVLNEAFAIYNNCPELKETDNYILALNNMGVYWIFKEGNYQKGLFYFIEALNNAKEIHGKDYSEIPAYYNNIGFVYDAMGKYDSAAYSFQYAISIWNKDSLKNADNIGKGYANLNSVNRRSGNIEKALDYAYKSLKVRKKLHGDSHTETGEAYCNLGISLLDMNMENEAFESFKKAENIFVNSPDASPRQLFSVYNSLGNTYAELKDYQPSNAYYYKALQTAKNSEIGTSHPDYALVLSNMANNYLDLGEKQLAIENYKKSLTIYNETMGPNSLDASISYGQIGKFYERQNDYEQAIYYYITQLNIQRNLSGVFHSEMEHNYRLVSNSYFNLGKLQLAYIYQDSAIAVKDSLQNIEKLSSLAEMKEKYESEINKEEINILSIKNKLAENTIETRNRMLLIIGFFSMFTISLIIILYKQRRQKEQLSYENNLYQSELKALRAQISPHFIFNSLNSIRYYISENAGNIAEDYLIRFADLMRNILIQSGHNVIPLSDEIKTLELYLGLEKQRLEDNFEYHIYIDGNIDAHKTSFPSLILQPFAENAVKHAFSNKKDGRIHIDIKLSNELLKVTIRDNGPGMNERDIKSTSQGMALTQSRIEKFSALHKINPQFLISSSEKGTTIYFSIPYKSI